MTGRAARHVMRRAQEEPSLFPTEDAVAAIDDDLAAWRKLCELAGGEVRSCGEWRTLSGLGRDLRGLRDCYVAARNPRVRAELLREAKVVSGRMRRCARRFWSHRTAS